MSVISIYISFFWILVENRLSFQGLNSIWWSASPQCSQRSGDWTPEIFGGFQSMGSMGLRGYPKLSIFWWEKSEKSMISCGQKNPKPFHNCQCFPRFRGWGIHWKNLRFMKCCFIYKWHVRCCFCFDYYYLLLLVSISVVVIVFFWHLEITPSWCQNGCVWSSTVPTASILDDDWISYETFRHFVLQCIIHRIGWWENLHRKTPNQFDGKNPWVSGENFPNKTNPVKTIGKRIAVPRKFHTLVRWGHLVSVLLGVRLFDAQKAGWCWWNDRRVNPWLPSWWTNKKPWKMAIESSWIFPLKMVDLSIAML